MSGAASEPGLRMPFSLYDTLGLMKKHPLAKASRAAGPS